MDPIVLPIRNFKQHLDPRAWLEQILFNMLLILVELETLNYSMASTRHQILDITIMVTRNFRIMDFKWYLMVVGHLMVIMIVHLDDLKPYWT